MKGRIRCKVIVIRGQMMQGFPYVHLVVGGGHDISTALSYTHTHHGAVSATVTLSNWGKNCAAL